VLPDRGGCQILVTTCERQYEALHITVDCEPNRRAILSFNDNLIAQPNTY
jgi:hypothetical protein